MFLCSSDVENVVDVDVDVDVDRRRPPGKGKAVHDLIRRTPRK